MAGQFIQRLRARLLSGIAITALVAGGAPAQITTQYTYDALGRVTSAVNSDGKTVGYTYDTAGNRVQVSNTVPVDELIPTAFTTSNAQPGDGLTTPNGMRDGAFNVLASMHGTNGAAGNWTTANLGGPKVIDHIDLAPTNVSPWAVTNTNGLQVQWSTDNTSWTTVTTTSGATLNQYMTIPMGGVTAQYVRLLQPSAVRMAVGDFRLYGHNVVTNHPPVADSFSAPPIVSTGGTIDLTGHIHDADNDTLTISGFNAPTAAQHGNVTTASATSFSYVPTVAGFTGTDTFSYTISDTHSATSTGLITVTVNAAPPVAGSFPVSVVENTNNNSLQAWSYLSGGTANSVAVVSGPSHGTISQNGLGFLYTPTPSYTGSDSLTYNATGPGGTSNTATITITVTLAPPHAAPSGTVAPYNSSNNYFPAQLYPDSGPIVSVAKLTNPSNGTASVSELGFVYTPSTGYSGTDSFQFQVTGPQGATSTNTASISVTSSNAPTVSPNSVTVPYNATSYPMPLLVTGAPASSVGYVASPSHGSLSVSGTSMTYTPQTGYSGPDSFYYYASGLGPAYNTSGSALMSITVSPGAPQLTASVLPVSYTGTRDPNGTYPGTPVTVSPSNGTAPYTYSWQYVSGDTRIAISQSNAATVTWYDPGTIPPGGYSWTAVWKCLVTDATGATVYTQNVNVEIDESDFS